MHWFAILIAAAIALFVLDRLALWMDDRGWLYYRKRRPDPSGMTGNGPDDPPEQEKGRDEG